jgi:hypothetical protein
MVFTRPRADRARSRKHASVTAELLTAVVAAVGGLRRRARSTAFNMKPPPVGRLRCDPCAHAPTAAQAAVCRKATRCGNGTSACSFVKDLQRTLAFPWNTRRARGWGNYWPYLRTYHYTAALLGRRLLLQHADHVLPTNFLALDGEVSWRLPPNDTRTFGATVSDGDLHAWRAAGRDGACLKIAPPFATRH